MRQPVRPSSFAFDFTHSNGLRGASSALQAVAVVGWPELDDSAMANIAGRALPPLLADWNDLASAVYLADRFSRRQDPVYERHPYQWQRSIGLRIPLRRPEVWSDPRVHEHLLDVLDYLTGDWWQLEFTKFHGSCRSSELQMFLPGDREEMSSEIGLFSGGLDSLAGAVRQISEAPARRHVLVSSVTSTVQGARQREIVQYLRTVLGAPLAHVSIEIRFDHSGDWPLEEPSQRSRGFLFLSQALITAAMVNSERINVWENGVGAINLPYDGRQLGTHNTRAVHPLAIAKMKQLAEALLGRRINVRNGFVFETKGEACRKYLSERTRAAVPMTFSCDGFPVRRAGKPQCGKCTSCLLRRLSLEAAGLSHLDRGEEYLWDLSLPRAGVRLRHLRGLNAMEEQAQTLAACLRSASPWTALSSTYPELHDVSRVLRDEPDVEARLTRLYVQYLHEWESFSARKSLPMAA